MKKILSLVLVAAMALGMGVAVFAADSLKKFDNFANGQTLADGLSTATNTNYTVQGQAVNVGVIHPMNEETLTITLWDTMFFDAPEFYTPQILTTSQIRNSKMAVGTTIRAGSKALKNAKIDSKTGQVKVEFADEFVSTSDLDFEISVYLTINNKRKNAEGITIYGTLENPVTEVYSDDDYVDLSSGYVAEAMEFNSKIEVDLGNGVSIFTKLFKGKKYYGIANRELDEYEDVVFSKYPDIDNIVTLKTVGLNSTGDIVRLDTDYSNYYVYDKDMNYLGQSNEMLPYSAKYYLANKKLDIPDDVEEEDEDEDDEEPQEGSNPSTGGDNGRPNANANPGTGR